MTDKPPVYCISAACPKKKHLAQWLMFPDRTYFPVCQRVKDKLTKPTKDDPGLPETDFVPLP